MTTDEWLESLVLGEVQEKILIWVLMSSVLILLPFRLYLRFSKYKHLLSDDYILMISFALLITLGAINTYQFPILYIAYDLLSSDIPFPDDFSTGELRGLGISQFSKQFIIWTVQWLCKLSFLVFLRRMLGGWRGYMSWWCAVLGVCLLSWLVAMLINCFTCFPPARLWTGKSCYTPSTLASSNNALLATLLLDLLSSLAVIVLPCHLLSSMSLSRNHKTIAGSILTLGFLITLLSIFRIVLLTLPSQAPNFYLLSIIHARFSQILATSSVFLATLPALRLSFNDTQKRELGDLLKRRKQRTSSEEGIVLTGKSIPESTMVSSSSKATTMTSKSTTTTYPGNETEPTIEKPAATTASSPFGIIPTININSETQGVVRRKSSLRGLRGFIRRESAGIASKHTSSSSNGSQGLLGAAAGPGGVEEHHDIFSMSHYSISPPSHGGMMARFVAAGGAGGGAGGDGMQPLQIRLHQVIPDIEGDETSPTIRRREYR